MLGLRLLIYAGLRIDLTLEVPGGPTQSQVDCGTENRWKASKHLWRQPEGRGGTAGSVEIRILQINSNPEQ